MALSNLKLKFTVKFKWWFVMAALPFVLIKINIPLWLIRLGTEFRLNGSRV